MWDDGDYDPNGAIATITDRPPSKTVLPLSLPLQFSGSGGGGECGGDLRTNVYANTLPQFLLLL